MVVKYLKKFFFSFIWLGVLLFVIDIVSKHIALNAFGGWELFTAEPNPAPSASFLPGFMSFTITFNTGAAWGIFGNLEDTARRIILIGISLVMSVAFIVFYIVKFKKLNNWYKAFLMCLAAGAIGNLIDRAFYPDGKVIDFIRFDFIDFPVFNFADAVLVVSIIGMIIYMIVEEILAFVKKRKNAAEPQLNSEQAPEINENTASNIEENKEEKKEENKENNE